MDTHPIGGPEIPGQGAKWRARALGWLGLAVLLGLAAAPAALVFWHRWLGYDALYDRFRATWCSVVLLCRMALPSYFLLVFGCAGLLLLLLVLLRAAPALQSPPAAMPTAAPRARQRSLALGLGLGALIWLAASALRSTSAGQLPGWEWLLGLLGLLVAGLLYDFPLAAFGAAWRQRPVWLVDGLVAHIALVGCLAARYGGGTGLLLFAALLALSGARLLAQWRSVPPAYWLMTLALVLGTAAIDGWWFSVIGDEYSFLRTARDIALRQDLNRISAQLFDGEEVYGAHPYFSSLVQATTMWLFGPDNFGWRFSAIYLTAVAIPLFHIFYSALLPRTAALAATTLVASSHYLLSFGKIGYNNLQALAALGLVLALSIWAVRSRSLAAFVGLGSGLGLCFYVYPAAFYNLPVALLMLLIFLPGRPNAHDYRPHGRALLLGLVAGALTLAMWIFPLIDQPGYWQQKLPGTIFYSPQRIATPEAASFQLISNLLYSLVSFLYVPEESHFVVVGYSDPLTGALLLLGALLTLVGFWRSRAGWFVAAGFMGTLLAVGVSHDRDFPAATRMFLMLPWFALFAALGLAWVIGRLERLGVSQRVLGGLALATVALVVALNIYQAYPLSQQRSAGRYQTFQELLLRMAPHLFDSDDGPRRRVLLLNDPDTLNLESLVELLRLYGVRFERDQFVELVVRPPESGSVPADYLSDAGTIPIINPRLEEGRLREVTAQLAAAGLLPCPVYNTIGEERLKIWLPPGLWEMCAEVDRGSGVGGWKLEGR